MTKKKIKEKEQEVSDETLPIPNDVRPAIINPNIIPARPFHKPVTSGSVRPFGGKR